MTNNQSALPKVGARYKNLGTGRKIYVDCFGNEEILYRYIDKIYQSGQYEHEDLEDFFDYFEELPEEPVSSKMETTENEMPIVGKVYWAHNIIIKAIEGDTVFFAPDGSEYYDKEHRVSTKDFWQLFSNPEKNDNVVEEAESCFLSKDEKLDKQKIKLDKLLDKDSAANQSEVESNNIWKDVSEDNEGDIIYKNHPNCAFTKEFLRGYKQALNDYKITAEGHKSEWLDLECLPKDHFEKHGEELIGLKIISANKAYFLTHIDILRHGKGITLTDFINQSESDHKALIELEEKVGKIEELLSNRDTIQRILK